MSSFGAFSFRTCGTLSTNFLACLRLMTGEGCEEMKRCACQFQLVLQSALVASLFTAQKARPLTSTKFMFGMTLLTSLMTFAFCAASILVKVMVKVVFSFGFSSSAAGAAPPAAAPAAGAAAMGAATAMSAIFSRLCVGDDAAMAAGR